MIRNWYLKRRPNQRRLGVANSSMVISAVRIGIRAGSSRLTSRCIEES